MPYLLEFENLRNLSITKFCEVIKATPGISVNDLRVRDLNTYEGQRIDRGEGVYLFKSGSDIVYVGKCTSMSFIERIPKHFDFRSYAWFHRLLEVISDKHFGTKGNKAKEFVKALDWAYSNTQLVLINFDKREEINEVERILRSSLEPYNQFKIKMNYDENKAVGSYVQVLKDLQKLQFLAEL